MSQTLHAQVFLFVHTSTNELPETHKAVMNKNKLQRPSCPIVFLWFAFPDQANADAANLAFSYLELTEWKSTANE